VVEEDDRRRAEVARAGDLEDGIERDERQDEDDRDPEARQEELSRTGERASAKIHPDDEPAEHEHAEESDQAPFPFREAGESSLRAPAFERFDVDRKPAQEPLGKRKILHGVTCARAEVAEVADGALAERSAFRR